MTTTLNEEARKNRWGVARAPHFLTSQFAIETTLDQVQLIWELGRFSSQTLQNAMNVIRKSLQTSEEVKV